jgi:RNA polymerase sigma-70 factor (ECF subfamily)
MLPERSAMDWENEPLAASAEESTAMPAEARFLEQLRRGDADAGHQLVRDYYPGIYRYLLSLAERPDVAEDLTQETFLQAWRHLDQFQGRAPLRAWLYGIARREFLRALRSRRSQTSLDELAEVAEPHGPAWTEGVQLRIVLCRLPREEREVVLLHYLEGYNCQEIARIVRAPVGTVKQRLMTARAHLQQELGEGDLAYLNEPSVPMRQWAWLPLAQMRALETRLVLRSEGDRAAPGDRATKEEGMERREFLRHAAAGAAALMLPDAEKEVIDARLTQKVALTFKGVALSDLCEHLQKESGVHVAAGSSVADEKVTIFCEKMPLRDVMRQLSRPFGYTWLRSRKEGGEYRYELVQDLRSQLLEEELRNRDRHASLLALAKEMDRYRPYLELSPEEALTRSKSASAGEKKLLEQFAIDGWAAIQMYFRLSPQQSATIRTGQWLIFVPDPKPGELPLPSDLERGILQCQPYRRLIRREDGGFDGRGPTRGIDWSGSKDDSPNSLPLTAFPEIHARVCVTMPERELGQYAYEGSPGFSMPGGWNWGPQGPWAVGRSSSFLEPNNAAVNARLARDPTLRPRVCVQPPAHDPNRPVGEHAADPPGPASGRKVTSADMLEALHQASGMPIVADYYTRLYDPEALSLHDQPLFEVLNRLCDEMHLRWNKEGSWLQFRSTSFYYDRLKEVPNRQLECWMASRRHHGSLTLEDLVEIAQLSDTQLDAADMAEGAQEYLGLKEWGLVRSYGTALIRQPLRALAAFTPEQRREMLTPAGLPFARMSLAQQQQYIAFALKFGAPLQSLDELAGATLRVRYTQPGWFEWRPPGPWWLRYVVALEPGKRLPLPQIRERSREAALQALRGIDPQIREAVLQAIHRADPLADTASMDEAAQIVPTGMELEIISIPDSTNNRSLSVYTARDGGLTVSSTW